MTKHELARAVAYDDRLEGFSIREVDAVLSVAFDIMSKTIASGERMIIHGFGKFHTQPHDSHYVIHPVTKEPFFSKPNIAIRFKAASTLKRLCNPQEEYIGDKDTCEPSD